MEPSQSATSGPTPSQRIPSDLTLKRSSSTQMPEIKPKPCGVIGNNQFLLTFDLITITDWFSFQVKLLLYHFNFFFLFFQGGGMGNRQSTGKKIMYFSSHLIAQVGSDVLLFLPQGCVSRAMFHQLAALLSNFLKSARSQY